MKRNIFLFAFFSLFTFHFSFAQSWLWSNNGIGLGWVNSVASDGQGNCFFSGFFDDYSTLNFSGNILANPQLNQDGGSTFITKVNKNGTILWANQSINYGNTLFGNGNVIALDNRENIYITADFNDTVILGIDTFIFLSNITAHYYLAKYDRNGNLLWATQPQVQIDSDQIGTNYVSTDRSGNAFVTGLFNADTVFLGSIFITGSRKVVNAFIVKYDSTGNVLWASQSTGKTQYGSTSNCVTNDKNGNSYITGGFVDSITFGSIKLNSLPSYTEGIFFLTKYDPNGSVIWAKQALINSHQSGSEGYALVTDLSGNVYVAGNFEGTVWLGSDTIIGSTTNNIFLAKYDSNGNVLWAKNSQALDGNNWAVTTISIDNYKHIYLSGGGGKGVCTLKFGNDTLSLNDTATYDQASIVFKFDSNGNVLCGSIIQGGGKYWNAIASDTSGRYVYFGSTTATPLIFGEDTINPFTYPVLDPYWGINYFPFAARWQACDTNIFSGVVQKVNSREEFVLYPNPNWGRFTIALKNVNEPAQVEVYNVLGEEIYRANLSSEHTQINLSGQPEGVYFYRVLKKDGELVGEGKLIIE